MEKNISIEDIINNGKKESLLREEDSRLIKEWFNRNNFYTRMGLIEIETDITGEFTYWSAFLMFKNENYGIFLTSKHQNMKKDSKFYLCKENLYSGDFFWEYSVSENIVEGEEYNFFIVQKKFEGYPAINLKFCFTDENICENRNLFCGGVSLRNKTKVFYFNFFIRI